MHCRHLNESLEEFSPDFVIYVAGTSVLSTDITGGLCLSPQVSLSTFSYHLSVKYDASVILVNV